MNLALTVLNDLPDEMEWALGGGTALSLYLNHRVSFDVDIFLEHPRALKELITNTKIKQITPDWEYPGNYLKLILSEGEIDFILASNVTETPHQFHSFQGSQIPIESPEEIIAKKIKYRGSQFTLRDTFDLAATIHSRPNILDSLSEIIELDNTIPKVLQRIQFLKANQESFKIDMILTGKKYLLKKMFDICIESLNQYTGT